MAEITAEDFIKIINGYASGKTSGEIHGDALRSALKKVNDNKKPHWIGNYAPYRCDQCGKHSDSMTNFCWNCGADMRE